MTDQAVMEHAGTQAAERTRMGRTYCPNVDIIEQPDALVVLADMPGAESTTLARDSASASASELMSKADCLSWDAPLVGAILKLS